MAASDGCSSFLTLSCAGAVQNQHVSHPTTFLGVPKNNQRKRKTPHRLVVVAVTQGSAESSKSDEKIPSWAKPDSDEPPPWARDEPNNNSSQQEGFEIPFYAYLFASAITAIAAVTNQHLITNCFSFLLFPTFHSYVVCIIHLLLPQIGSIFEYVNQKPVFGVLSSDSVFYAPLLGFFVFTGIPSSVIIIHLCSD